MTVTFKDRKSEKNQLGQFMTPDAISQYIVDKSNYRGVIIEPSFGLGSFLYKIENKYANNNIIGIEYDEKLFNEYAGNSKVFNKSFYKFTSDDLPSNIDYITFSGNPPYRTPAFSLTSEDREHVKNLIKKYKLTGVKEEAVFFIAHMVDIINELDIQGELELILPKTIFENASPAFNNFRKFLEKYCPLTNLKDITDEYPDVAQSLVIATFKVNQIVNNHITYDYVIKDSIIMSDIFKRTYLGSVPCEGLFLSCDKESKESFQKRMCDIFIRNSEIKQSLLYNEKYHLRALNNDKTFDEKLESLQNIVDKIKSTVDVSIFEDNNNYKTLAHRNDVRYYFRHKALTNLNFVYIINSNPCPSFYYPGNPTKTSTDYFGYCDYDCNRNSSPGANRTIPLFDISKNVTDKFLKYWKANTTAPISDIFDYISHISKSGWYKNYKQKYQRFYFGLPLDFDRNWKPEKNIIKNKNSFY
tara:strand:- start:54 stop:1466 length:1413 start_codon:yes stop_codon:yes gene_type:complete